MNILNINHTAVEYLPYAQREVSQKNNRRQIIKRIMDGFASMVSSSLGLGGEFMTPIGKGVENATSESLVNPDWTLNMQICDEVGTVAA